jgi:hypothetical protein
LFCAQAPHGFTFTTFVFRFDRGVRTSIRRNVFNRCIVGGQWPQWQPDWNRLKQLGELSLRNINRSRSLPAPPGATACWESEEACPSNRENGPLTVLPGVRP